jgi:hypothetical protein
MKVPFQFPPKKDTLTAAEVAAVTLANLSGCGTGVKTALAAAAGGTNGMARMADLPENGWSAPVSLPFADPLNPDCAGGLYRKITMTDDAELNPPSNGLDGMKWKGRFTASGADRTLSLDAAIVIPSDSTFAGSKVIPSGETLILQLEYSGSAWWLTTLVGGY